MRGDESRIIRFAEMHAQMNDAREQYNALAIIVNMLRKERNAIDNDKVTVWLVSAIQNRQALLRAKIARYEYEILEASTHTRPQADGDDDQPDNVVIIR